MATGRWCVAALLVLLLAGVAEAFSASLVGTASKVVVDGDDDQVKIDLGNGNYVQFNPKEAKSGDLWHNLMMYAELNKKVKVTVKDGVITNATTPGREAPPEPAPEPLPPDGKESSGKSPA